MKPVAPPLRQFYAHHPGLRVAVNTLFAGGTVAYPTEAVWGLGCDPNNAAAVEHILRLKRRHVSKGLILIAAHKDLFRPLLDSLDAEHLRAIDAGGPGPITWLVPNNGYAPDWITGGRTSVAIRITAHPVAAALSAGFGGPVVSTSANPQNLPPARSLTKVKAYFGANVHAYAPGVTGSAHKPSEIRDIVTGKTVRSGDSAP